MDSGLCGRQEFDIGFRHSLYPRMDTNKHEYLREVGNHGSPGWRAGADNMDYRNQFTEGNEETKVFLLESV